MLRLGGPETKVYSFACWFIVGGSYPGGHAIRCSSSKNLQTHVLLHRIFFRSASRIGHIKLILEQSGIASSRSPRLCWATPEAHNHIQADGRGWVWGECPRPGANENKNEAGKANSGPNVIFTMFCGGDLEIKCFECSIHFKCFGMLFARHFLNNFDLLVTVSFQEVSKNFDRYILIVLQMYLVYFSAIHLNFIFYGKQYIT